MSNVKKRTLESRLDGRQKIAALAVVEREFSPEEERLGFEEIAVAVGVTRKTLHQWRTQNKTFIDYVNILADEYLSAARPVVYKRLMQLIDTTQPSVKAIDLFMRREGLITTHAVVETKDAGNRGNNEIAENMAEIDALLTEEDTEI